MGTPDPVDVHVGSRVKLRRMLIGMSQEKLAEGLDLSFQQIQKYEKGSNRIGASRLFEIAGLLGVPVQFFFDEINSQYQTAMRQREDASSVDALAFIQSKDGVAFNHAYLAIRSRKLRQRVLELVQAIAGP